MKKFEEIEFTLHRFSEDWLNHLKEEGVLNYEKEDSRALQWLFLTLERAQEEFRFPLWKMYWLIHRLGVLFVESYGIELDEYNEKVQSEFLMMIYSRLDKKDEFKDRKSDYIFVSNTEENNYFEFLDQLDPPPLEETEEPQQNVVLLKPAKRGELFD